MKKRENLNLFLFNILEVVNMSVVSGKKIVKNYRDFQDIVENIGKKLDNIGITIPTISRRHSFFSPPNIYERAILISNSVVLFRGYLSCLEEESRRNCEGSRMGVESKIIGEDHEKVRGDVSKILRQSKIEIEKERNILPNDDYQLFNKLKEKGMLKE